MAKTKISEFSTTPGNNTDINGINIAEGCAPSGINNAIRELMSDLKEWQSGAMDVYVIPQGTAAAPGIQLYGDLDTGLYGYAANQLGVAVGGASAGYFSSAGWVGNVNGTITGDINATTIDTTNLEVTNIKAKDGTAAITIADSTGVVSVSTQLAVDNLNLSGNTLSSSDTNGNIVLAPNGTGDVHVDADTLRVGDSNANAIITTNGTGDLTLNTNGGTNSGAITIEDGVNGNINVVPNGTGGVYLDNTAGTSLFVRNTTSSASGSSFVAFQNKDGAGNYRTVARASGLTTSNGGNGSFVVETAFSNVLYKGLLINSESDVFFYDSNGNQALKWDSSDKYLGINQTSPTAALDVVGDVKVSGTVNAATIDLTNIEVTNIKAKDGSASATIADSTGVMTIASSVLTTTDINGGTIDGTTIGGSTAAAGTFTTATATTGNITTVNATTVDTTNIEVTNIKAKDGTAALSIADSTGNVTVSSLLNVDNLRLDGNTLSSTNTNGAINLTPNGTGQVTVTNDALINSLTVGRGAGAVSTNTAVGASALAANTSGVQNNAFGNLALTSATSNGYNDAFGYTALQYNTGAGNAAFGNSAMRGVNGSSTGGSNAAFGASALIGLTTGANNVAVGNSALQANTTASGNTAVGYQAGYGNQTGFDNTFLGSGAATNVTTSYNTLLGLHAGYGFGGVSSGNGANVMVGWKAGYKNTSGSGNTFIGTSSGYENTTGTQNTFVGPNTGFAAAGFYITTGSKNTILGAYSGNQGGLDIRTASNRIVLSDGDGNPRWYIDNVGAAGYGPTTGGAVTQATSRTTGVTLNTPTGAITLVSAAGTTTWQTFTVTNSSVAATDTLIVNQKSGTDLYEIHVTAVAAGSFNISFKTTGGTTTEQPVFNYALIKGQTS